jgi:NAD-dependent deacetylase
MQTRDFSSETLRAINDAARIILRAKHTVALAGAGLSAESGVPTFRGPGGLWTKKGEPDMRGYEAFLRDPKAWWENRLKPQDPEMEAFTKALENSKPNPGHYALAEMERAGLLHYIVTQNVDNLHQAAGSTKVAEIHGNRYKVRCLSCGARYHRDEIPLAALPPRCPKCAGIMKGDGVMFGEPIPQDVLGLCHQQALLADCMLVVGTSALVYPAASLPTIAQQRGAPLIEVNPLPTALSGACDITIRAPSGEALPYLLERITVLKEDTQ